MLGKAHGREGGSNSSWLYQGGGAIPYLKPAISLTASISAEYSAATSRSLIIAMAEVVQWGAPSLYLTEIQTPLPLW